MKIIVAGGRDFKDKDFMELTLCQLVDSGKLPEYVELVCGMAKGADLMAKEIFDRARMKVHERPADWQDMSEPCKRRKNYFGWYNALAGMKRNHAMGDEADILVAFWDGKSKGTKDMIDYMRKLSKPVYVFNYEEYL